MAAPSGSRCPIDAVATLVSLDPAASTAITMADATAPTPVGSSPGKHAGYSQSPSSETPINRPFSRASMRYFARPGTTPLSSVTASHETLLSAGMVAGRRLPVAPTMARSARPVPASSPLALRWEFCLPPRGAARSRVSRGRPRQAGMK